MSITARIDKTTEIGSEYLNTIIPAPKSVKIELTGRCNFDCGFCAHKLQPKGRQDMEWDLYKRVTREMLDAGVEELGMFYIGESLMCDWLPEAIEWAKTIGFPYVFLTTNGSILNENKAKSLMDAGLDSLKVSFNNADAAQFRAVTGRAPHVFDTIKKNIRTAYQIREKGGYKTKLYASSIMYDGEQQKRMEAAVNEIRPFVDEHYWLPLFSFGGQATEGEKALDMAPPAVGNPGRLGNMRPPLPCWAVFKEGHITWDGLLSACCFDCSSKWAMADLNKVSFIDGWNSPEFQALRLAHLKKDIRGTACESCIARH